MSVPGPILDARTVNAPTIVRFGTPFTPFTTAAPISCAASGDNTLVAGVAGQIIRVFRIFFLNTIATNITLKSGASTALTGAMPFAANGSLTQDVGGEPWYVCAAGQSFVLNSSVATQISGTVYYVQA